MKNRLIELLQEIDQFPEKTCLKNGTGKECGDCKYKLDNEKGCDLYARKADYMIAKGVFCPPCKVGDYVYNLMECSCEDIDGVYTVCEFYDEGMCACRKRCPYLYRIEKCLVTDSNLLIFTKKWGKTVFLTREEAEQALRKEDEGK